MEYYHDLSELFDDDQVLAYLKEVATEDLDPRRTSYGAIVPRMTGFLSAISSMLIMYVIVRSSRGLSTIYHRIMFGMSVFDIFTSVAMGLTTLPMPKDDIWTNMYRFHGTRLGNFGTCTAQGFFFVFGAFGSYTYLDSLCMYYACAIAFGMKDDKIKKYVEPLLHLLPITVALCSAIPPLIWNMYNPSLDDAWCNVHAFPSYCVSWRSWRHDKIECIRGREMKGLSKCTAIVLACGLGVIIVCLLLVVCKVCMTETQIVQRVNHVMSHLSYNAKKLSHNRKQHTKVVLVQAIVYVLAFVLSQIFLVFLLVGYPGIWGLGWETTIKLQLFFQPINGFFNLIIFLAQKIYTFRRVDQDLSVFQCLHKLFFSRSEDPIVISEIPNIESVVSHSVVNGNEDEKDDIENDSLANETLKVTGNYSKVTGNHSKVISNSVKSTFVSGGDNMSYDDLEGTLKNTQNEQLELGSTFSLSSSFSRHGLSRFSDVFTLASKGLSSTGMSYKSEE